VSLLGVTALLDVGSFDVDTMRGTLACVALFVLAGGGFNAPSPVAGLSVAGTARRRRLASMAASSFDTSVAGVVLVPVAGGAVPLTTIVRLTLLTVVSDGAVTAGLVEAAADAADV